jgi:hypothetical protein
MIIVAHSIIFSIYIFFMCRVYLREMTQYLSLWEIMVDFLNSLGVEIKKLHTVFKS